MSIYYICNLELTKKCKKTLYYYHYKFYTLFMFNFQVFLLLSICDDVKQTRSVDSVTFCFTISKSLTSILPCRKIDYPLAP